MTAAVTTTDTIGERIKAKQKEKHERPLRPEIGEAELTALERVLARHLQEPQDDGATDAFYTLFELHASALLLDSRERTKLLEKLTKTREKSNRRKSQLRQQNKTIELWSGRMRALYDTLTAVTATNKDLLRRLEEERIHRRRAEDEVYHMRRLQPPERGLVGDPQ